MMGWFGKCWPSILCEQEPQVAIPVGEHCAHCEEVITTEDSGVIYSNGPVAHRNCFMRGILGSVAHIEKRCSCFVDGSSDSDEPGLTRREAANAAVRAWARLNGIKHFGGIDADSPEEKGRFVN